LKIEGITVRKRKYEIMKGLRRRFVTSFLDLIVLAILESIDQVTGYTLVKHILQRYKILLSSGTVYSTLYYMERKGLVKGEWKERKRIYRATQEGTQVIRIVIEKIESLQSLLEFGPVSRDLEQTSEV